jgi:hypothetical protein
MGLPEAVKEFLTNSEKPDELPAFLSVCQKLHNQIIQPQAEVHEVGTKEGFEVSGTD